MISNTSFHVMPTSIKGVLATDADVGRGREAARASAVNCLAAMLTVVWRRAAGACYTVTAVRCDLSGGENVSVHRRKVKMDPPTMALISRVTCPDCGTFTLVPFSTSTLAGRIVCLNPACMARYPVQLRPHPLQKDAVDRLRQTARRMFAESRAIDWSSTSAVLGTRESASRPSSSACSPRSEPSSDRR